MSVRGKIRQRIFFLKLELKKAVDNSDEAKIADCLIRIDENKKLLKGL